SAAAQPRATTTPATSPSTTSSRTPGSPTSAPIPAGTPTGGSRSSRRWRRARRARSPGRAASAAARASRTTSRVYAPRSEPGNDPDKYVTTVLAHVKAETGKTFTTTSTVAEILAVGAGAEKGFIEGHIEAEGFSMTGIKCVPRDSAELPKAV